MVYTLWLHKKINSSKQIERCLFIFLHNFCMTLLPLNQPQRTCIYLSSSDYEVATHGGQCNDSPVLGYVCLQALYLILQYAIFHTTIFFLHFSYVHTTKSKRDFNRKGKRQYLMRWKQNNKIQTCVL